jgi:hypothetical protein
MREAKLRFYVYQESTLLPRQARHGWLNDRSRRQVVDAFESNELRTRIAAVPIGE